MKRASLPLQTLFAAVHESGNGMARPRSAANLLDCGWEA